MNPAASARPHFSFEPTRTGREPTFSRVSVRLNEMNSAPLDTGKTAYYGGAMADRQDTSRVAEPLDLEPGYRLDARGRQQAEDDRLGLLDPNSATSRRASAMHPIPSRAGASDGTARRRTIHC